MNLEIKSKILEYWAVRGQLAYGFGDFEHEHDIRLELWKSTLPKWKQVHGRDVAQVDQANQVCGEVDALVSRTAGLPVAVVTADCVPILLVASVADRPVGVAAVHSGWRGTIARIADHAVEQLANAIRGETTRELASGSGALRIDAVVGPCIGPCCYEVSEDLAAQFVTSFPDVPAQKVVPSFRRLDLAALNEARLNALVDPYSGRVERLEYCTYCSETPRFASFRRDGSGRRQYSGLVVI